MTVFRFHLCFAVLLLGIAFDQSCRQEVNTECKEYYSQPSYDREKAFRNYSLEKQLTVYRCGLVREPPELGLAAYIADRGERNVPILLETLRAEKDERSQAGIIYIFEVMSIKGSIRDRQDVIEQLRQVVSSMRHQVAREEAEQSLMNIIKNSSTK